MQTWCWQKSSRGTFSWLENPQRKEEWGAAKTTSRVDNSSLGESLGTEPPGAPTPQPPSHISRHDLRLSVNTHTEQNSPTQLDTMGATIMRPPRIQAEQRVTRACLSCDPRPISWSGHRRRGSGYSLGPALPIFVVGEGAMGKKPTAHFLPPGLSHFLCQPCTATSHSSAGSWKTHFL